MTDLTEVENGKCYWVLVALDSKTPTRETWITARYDGENVAQAWIFLDKTIVPDLDVRAIGPEFVPEMTVQ